MAAFLFSKPKLIDGVASVIDLFGVYTMYSDCHSPQEADRRAITSDMRAIQGDFIVALEQLGKECPKKEKH